MVRHAHHPEPVEGGRLGGILQIDVFTILRLLLWIDDPAASCICLFSPESFAIPGFFVRRYPRIYYGAIRALIAKPQYPQTVQSSSLLNLEPLNRWALTA
jgi:hypothetical protein